MLNPTELEAYFERLSLSLKARALVRHIRACEPSRRTQSTPESVSSRYPSRKMGCTIQAESHTNELAAVYLWDHDSETYEFYDQPPQIQIRYTDKLGRTMPRNVTPDYFILQADFAGWVECKQEAWLVKHLKEGGKLYELDEAGNWRCPAGEEFAAERGLGFRVRPSSETNSVLLRNLHFLSDFFVADPRDTTDLTAHEIFTKLQATPWVNLIDLLDDKSEKKNAVVYGFIAHDVIRVDLGRQLLCEPHDTKVFRSVEVQNAYLAVEPTREDTTQSPSRVLRLEPGEALVWDGQPWRIANVGSLDVTLQDPEGKLCALPRKGIEALMAKGLVRGIAEEMNERSEAACRIIARASNEDLREARERFEKFISATDDEIRSPANKEFDSVSPRHTRAERRWRRKYLDAEQRYGSGFLGLVTHRAAKGNRSRKLGNTVLEKLKDAIDAWAIDRDNKSLRSAWGELNVQLEETGLCPISEKTFRAAAASKDKYEIVGAQEGSKVAYALEHYTVMQRNTSRHGDRCFQIAHIDHTQLDLQLVGREYGEEMNKPWLTILFDAYSRYVLAFVLSFDAPSYRSCMNVLRVCVARHHRMPDIVVSDSGREFTSIYYETLLARCKSTIKVRSKGKPRDGAVLERWFGVNNKQFIHSLRGNNQPLQNPRSMVNSHDPRGRAVWTLADFRTMFERYVEETYHQCVHPALGVSPADAKASSMIRSGAREIRHIDNDASFWLLTLPPTAKGTAKVIVGRGVKIKQNYYNCPSFRSGKWQNKNVAIRYNPYDVSEAYAYLGNEWIRLRSEYAELFAGRSEKEIAIRTQEIRARQSKAHACRTVTAMMIADHIRDAKQSEAVLLQRKRDQEERPQPAPSVSAHPSPAAVPATPASRADKRSKRASVVPGAPNWNNTEIQHFGQFQ